MQLQQKYYKNLGYKMIKNNYPLGYLVNITLVITLVTPLVSISLADTIIDPNPLRFQKEIKNFNWQDAKNSFPQHGQLFIGSSTIYKWKTARDFPNLPIINRGLAGAQISDINFYFNQIVARYKPAQVIFYCGDNDVADNKDAAQILADFSAFSRQLEQILPTTQILFLAIKPSPARWNIWSKMVLANIAIAKYCQANDRCTYIDTATPLLNHNGFPDKTLFKADGLHLSKTGYTIWRDILSDRLNHQ